MSVRALYTALCLLAGLSFQENFVLAGSSVPVPLAASSVPVIRVKVGPLRPRVVISGDRLQFQKVVSGIPQLIGEHPEVRSWEVLCDPKGTGIVLRALDAARGQIPISERIQHGSLEIRSRSGLFSIDGKPYRSLLSLHSGFSVRSRSGRGSAAQADSRADLGCIAVNHLEFEQYLEGLVNHEFSSKWAESAVEAQVIAARTYALYRVQEERKSTHSLYDLESDEKDQVYGGAEKEDSKASQAVRRTRGLVLVAAQKLRPHLDAVRLTSSAPNRQGGEGAIPATHLKPLKAYYHSTCGGGTELPEQVWGAPSPGFKRRVSCAWCSDSPKYQWKAQFGGRELASTLKSPFKAGIPAQLEAVRVKAHSPSGRVDRVELKWREPRSKFIRWSEMSAQDFRMKLGAGRILSTWFTILGDQRQGWTFTGRGYGHGVGLCQWGAKNMGARGLSTQAILAHYYPDSQVARAW